MGERRFVSLWSGSSTGFCAPLAPFPSRLPLSLLSDSGSLFLLSSFLVTTGAVTGACLEPTDGPPELRAADCATFISFLTTALGSASTSSSANALLPGSLRSASSQLFASHSSSSSSSSIPFSSASATSDFSSLQTPPPPLLFPSQQYLLLLLVDLFPLVKREQGHERVQVVPVISLQGEVIEGTSSFSSLLKSELCSKSSRPSKADEASTLPPAFLLDFDGFFPVKAIEEISLSSSLGFFFPVKEITGSSSLSDCSSLSELFSSNSSPPIASNAELGQELVSLLALQITLSQQNTHHHQSQVSFYLSSYHPPVLVLLSHPEQAANEDPPNTHKADEMFHSSWSKLAQRMLKLNVDAAIDKDSTTMGFGLVLSDGNGSFVAVRGVPWKGLFSSGEAEAVTI
nr:transcription repressor OFP17-like [Ipomoea batatas]